jgi:hypothetical protein
MKDFAKVGWLRDEAEVGDPFTDLSDPPHTYVT